ncbi:hypothetical protein PN36_03320 [Candidatus Thiomargarita nelsonii]|uniref:Uncharacterized protein n=1 Tax=Candidatus Thiomargarita nelsonii TaxID=1003181 RepID=A0A0A6PAF8_9GAMM|nr:hypothetical protein PN36_03320 [Candidatus Thiomargarita nelsonii]
MQNIQKSMDFKIKSYREYLANQGLPSDQIRKELFDIFGDELIPIMSFVKKELGIKTDASKTEVEKQIQKVLGKNFHFPATS